MGNQVFLAWKKDELVYRNASLRGISSYARQSWSWDLVENYGPSQKYWRLKSKYNPWALCEHGRIVEREQWA